MKKKLNIAVTMELNWPYKRHYEPFAGIQEFAKEHPEWELCISNFPDFEMSKGAKFDGMIGRITEQSMKAARKAKIPAVNMWLESPVADQLPRVQVDYHNAGRLAAEHLIIRGFRQLAHVGFKKIQASKDHYSGMKEVANKDGVPYHSYTTRPDFAEKIKYWETFVSDLARMKKKWKGPVGIVVASDELAHAITTQFLKTGWRCPDDFAVVGTHNESLICNAVTPSLSSIEMGHRRCGYKAASLLNRLILDPTPTTEVIQVPPKELIVRGSSDAYAVDDPALTSALKYMVLNLHQQISVPDIAAAAGVGRQTLERRFRKKLDRTINGELVRLRISKMKRLLVKTDYTISEIGELVGFGTTVNMNVMFKKYTGTTPLAYKRTYL
jgi:LacI family transcriptional regulator